MLTLALDTSTRAQVVALLDDQRLLAHRQHRIAYNHGSTMLRVLEELLADHELRLADCDLLVAGLGPGSFTGLRVGLACAKGLARAASIPLVGVSSLASVAHAAACAAPGRPICAAADARRREIYAGVYLAEEGGVTRAIVEDRAWAPADLAAELGRIAQESGAVTLLGRGLEKFPQVHEHQDPRVVVRAPALSTPDGVALALLGRQRLGAHGADDLIRLEPNYVRPSDAEIQAARRAQEQE